MLRQSLVTDRLLLRQFGEPDVESFLSLTADPEVMEFVGVPLDATSTWRLVASYLGHWSMRGYGYWAVVEKKSNEFIGRIGVQNPKDWPGIELGWMIRRSHWGRGLAHEAAQSTIAAVREDLVPRSLISLIRPANHKSIRLAERLGGREKERIDIGGVPLLVFHY